MSLFCPRLLCSCFVCFCCVTFSFFGTTPRDWLGRTSPKWTVLCRVGRKTLTQSINQVHQCWIQTGVNARGVSNATGNSGRSTNSDLSRVRSPASQLPLRAALRPRVVNKGGRSVWQRRRSSVELSWQHLRRSMMCRGEKFSKSRVWDKISERSTLIFRYTWILLNYSVADNPKVVST